MLGKKFANRYEIQEKLGAGGMSIVYKGLDTLLNRLVTIKVLRDQYASDQDFVRRFHQEAQSVASLSHMNIVSIYDVGLEDGLHYLVMEFVEGQNLKEYIQGQGKLSEQKALPIAMQILDALEHAHDHGVIHRDIKPHNILINPQGRVKVTDFGIARAASESTLTYTGTIVGSVHYISPEQAKGITIGTKSDLYSAGAVLYEMVTGKLPFSGDSPIAVALQHIQNEPVPPHDLVPDLSKELSQVILKAMAKNPDVRYGKAQEMRYDLSRIYYGQGQEVNIQLDQENVSADTMIIPAVKDFRENTEYPEPSEDRYSKEIPPNENSKKSHKRLKPGALWALGAGGLLIIILVLWGVNALVNGYLNVGEVRVPDVEGKSLIEAKADLKEAGLDFEVDTAPHSTVEKDYVISQTIPPNQMVKKDRIIGLLVSEGPNRTRVPNLVGKSRRDAQVEINNKDLELEFTEAYDDRVPEGMVISQDPEAGNEVSEGSLVMAVVSLGREPKYTTMPNLVGNTLEEAKKSLKDHGLNIGNVREKESNVYFSGIVIGQDIAAGAQILQGDTVNVEYSTGPGPMAQLARVTFDVPDDGAEHRVRILVSDVKGDHYEYDQVHQPGDLIVEDVPFYSKGKVGIYLDGDLVFSQNVP